MLFSYKSGNSFLHKCPAWCKILFIPLINILFLCLPWQFAVGLIILQIVVAFCLRFTLLEQLGDLKPVIYYAFLLLIIKLVSIFISFFADYFSGELVFLGFSDFITKVLANFSWESEKDTIILLVKLFCVMQSASLVFKTSTSLQLREGIEKIEGAIRKILHLKKENTLTDSISMFLNFIPMVAKIWNQSKRAWFARGGKANLKMYSTLLPVLFSVGMKKAYNQARAISIRK